MIKVIDDQTKDVATATVVNEEIVWSSDNPKMERDLNKAQSEVIVIVEAIDPLLLAVEEAVQKTSYRFIDKTHD